MNKLISICILLLISYQVSAQKNTIKKMTEKIKKSESEWKSELSTQEYYVLREKGTDKPSQEGYTSHFEKGTYHCNACNSQLFASNSKFESHCGWPSFDDAIEGTVTYIKDVTHGMIRTEIICASCDSHLGHIFDDGPQETTGKRYCINTSSITFKKK
ncbi:MAG: peptide-methionine (R)-S-oxide reductase [Flavobacteriaceae bacterium]|nr:MAG: peptide-methionine (R)-S-oxide reductase [Flavobacteriaceae bacterium]